MDGDPSIIGPALPPGLSKPKSSPDHDQRIDTASSIGPALPPGFALRKCSDTEDSDSDSSSSEDEEPSRSKGVIGPQIPSSSTATSSSIGPCLPPGYVPVPEQASSDEEDASIGPRLPAPGEEKTVAQEFEERARLMKHRLTHTEEESAPERESWMTALPTVGLPKHMGLTARKLGSGSRVKYEDQSVWTDTPADRARKEQEGQGQKRPLEDEAAPRSERDIKLMDMVNDHNKKKRAESLLDMHNKKLHKKQKKEEKKRKKEKKKKDKKKKKNKDSTPDLPTRPERRPFDRDTDLQVNRFDAAQRKALVKRSQELNSKFGAGAQHFL